MIIEGKAGITASVYTLLTLPLMLLQVSPANIDLLSIADKIGVIGILLYISYTFSRKFDELLSEFQKQLRDEREKSDAIQKELIEKIIQLSERHLK